MGFHGYEHTSGIIGECSIADCPEGPQTHHHSPGSISYRHGCYQIHPSRPIVPRHRNDGPVDLSQYCTPTVRGTWSIGGQRKSTQASPHLQIKSNSSQHMVEHHAVYVPVEQARLYKSTPNVDYPKVSSENKDAKYDRSNNDSEKAELEEKAATLLNTVRVMASPLPVCHEHSHVCANTARIMGTEKVSAFSTTIASS